MIPFSSQTVRGHRLSGRNAVPAGGTEHDQGRPAVRNSGLD